MSEEGDAALANRDPNRFRAIRAFLTPDGTIDIELWPWVDWGLVDGRLARTDRPDIVGVIKFVDHPEWGSALTVENLRSLPEAASYDRRTGTFIKLPQPPSDEATVPADRPMSASHPSAAIQTGQDRSC